MGDYKPRNTPPDIIINYTNHCVRMKNKLKPEITKEGTFILPLPRSEDFYHEPFIELPFEYIISLSERKILSYKTQCECGDIIIWNQFGEN